MSVPVLKIGALAYHDKIYGSKELMTVVGIRATEVELEGDYSGGTHNVVEKDWLPMEGLVLYPRKIECPNKVNGSCTLHNIFCGYPDCEYPKE
jgi:hypothetical protein